MILGNSMLRGRNVPVAGEYEIKNVQAMKIMNSFRAGGSFTGYYAMDFNADVVLMGHDGPCYHGIAEGKIKVKHPHKSVKMLLIQMLDSVLKILNGLE